MLASVKCSCGLLVGQLCVEMESLLPMRQRMILFDRLGFDQFIEFDRGDVGVAGGLQV